MEVDVHLAHLLTVAEVCEKCCLASSTSTNHAGPQQFSFPWTPSLYGAAWLILAFSTASTAADAPSSPCAYVASPPKDPFRDVVACLCQAFILWSPRLQISPIRFTIRLLIERSSQLLENPHFVASVTRLSEYLAVLNPET